MSLVVVDNAGGTGAMTSVPDLLGLSHIALSSTVQLIVLLKKHVLDLRSIRGLLDLAEEKSRQLDDCVSSLKELEYVSDLDFDFFLRAYGEIQQVQRELESVHDEFNHSSTPRRFLMSTSLVQRISAVIEKLGNLNASLNTLGMIGNIVRRECSSIHDELSVLTGLLNRMLASNSPSSAHKPLLNAIRSSGTTVQDIISGQHPVRELFAKEHYSQIFLALGEKYYTGQHERGQDFHSASRYLQAAFDGGAKESAYFLGNLYYYGQGVNRCYETAFQFYYVGTKRDVNAQMKNVTLAAEAGSANGMRGLAYHCLHGIAHRQNISKAVRLLKNARKLGNFRCTFDLAHCYEHGIGVEQNLEEVVSLLQIGHSKGIEEATSSLAMCYHVGVGVERDYAKAAALYRQLRRVSFLGRNYQAYLGLLMIRGQGVEKNVRLGLKIIRAGLKKGFSVGWAVYGDCFRHGFGVAKDPETAINYYTIATNCSSGARGIKDAHVALAEMYEIGEGIAPDSQLATHHYIRGADRMSRVAQWKAAVFLEQGVGVPVHHHRAFYFFDMAARGGHIQAQRKAGEMYMKGFGVQRNRTRAIELLEKAVENGDLHAKSWLRRAKLSRFVFERRMKSI